MSTVLMLVTVGNRGRVVRDLEVILRLQHRTATVSTYVVRFLPKLAEFLNQRQGADANSGMITSS